jgi:S1-C subfamily serine protease
MLTLALVFHASPVQAQSAAAGFQVVEPSIVRIWAFDAKGAPIASASGFVVASDGQHSSLLTAAHVLKGAALIRVDVRNSPGLKAAVVSKEDANDVALLEINLGNLTPVTLAFRQLDVGDTVAAAGFYRNEEREGSQQARLLYPGTISAMLRDDRVLAFDNLNIQDGLSGGPMFDSATGAVLGMVVSRSPDNRIGGGYAMSAPLVLIGFLRAQGVRIAIDHGSAPQPARTTPAQAAYATPRPANVAIARSQEPANASAARSDSSPSILRALPGAGTVVVIYDTSRSTGANTGTYVGEAAADFANKFGQAFHVRAVTADAQSPNVAAIARLARDNNAIIAVTYGADFHALSSRTNGYGTITRTKWDFGLQSAMVDTYGVVWATSGKLEKSANSERDVQSAITSSLADLNDQDVAALVKQVNAGSDDSITTNLFRYALPMSNGAKKAFINLTPASNGAKAIVFPFSVALDAGLQAGDLVLAVNGISTVGKTQSQLSSLLVAATAAGPYDLLIEAADGTQQHLRIEAKDLRWYVDHRNKSASQ